MDIHRFSSSYKTRPERTCPESVEGAECVPPALPLVFFPSAKPKLARHPLGGSKDCVNPALIRVPRNRFLIFDYFSALSVANIPALCGSKIQQPAHTFQQHQ